MKDYTSPIETIMSNIIKTNEEQLEDSMLLSIEREIGFKVDKEELIKALKYDRKQYEKGFEDGLKSVLDKITEEIEQLPTNTRINWDGCCPCIDYPEIEYVDVSKAALLSIIDKYKAESEDKK